MLAILRQASGRYGRTLDYLIETAHCLRGCGIRDRSIERLVELAERHGLRVDALTARTGCSGGDRLGLRCRAALRLQQLQYLGRCQRTTEQVALADGRAELLEQRQLRRGLDALGDHLLVQRAAERDHGAHDLDVLRRCRSMPMTNERSIFRQSNGSVLR